RPFVSSGPRESGWVQFRTCNRCLLPAEAPPLLASRSQRQAQKYSSLLSREGRDAPRARRRQALRRLPRQRRFEFQLEKEKGRWKSGRSSGRQAMAASFVGPPIA